MPDGHLTFDITKMPQSQRLDVSPGGDGEMVGVAIKHVGEEAYAFGRELAVAVGAAHAGADRADMILLLG